MSAQTNSFFTPTQISGCAFWLDARDINGNGVQPANGTPVATWVDKSGNGRNFTQATAGNRPTFGTFLSAPGVSFTGASSQNLSNAYIQTGSGGRNMFLVFYDVNTTANIYGNPVLLYMATGNPSALGDWRAAYDGANNYLSVDAGSGAYTYRTSPNVTSMRTVRCVALWGYNAGSGFNTAYVYGNGTQFTTVVNSFANTNPLNVTNNGVTMVGGGPTGYATAVISEIIYYNTDITTAQRQQVEGYLAWKWGLQSSLPATHPYKNSPIPPLLSPPVTIPTSIQTNFFIPTQISGCQLWLDAADVNGNRILPARNSSISTWKDKSVNGYNVTQATAANQPVFQLNVQNGLPALQFPAISRNNLVALDTPAFNFGTTNRTSFFVIRNNWISGTPGSSPHWFWPKSGNGTAAQSLVGWIQSVERNGFGTCAISAPIGSFFILSNIFGASSLFEQMYTNGNPSNGNTLSRSGAFISATSVYRIGALDNADSGNSIYWFDGNMAEVILFNQTLTVPQIQQVEGYLAWKWGLQSSLPANHPYKTSPIPPLLSPPVSLPVVVSKTWVPIQISGCQLWLDAADSTSFALSGSTLTSWQDKSGTSKTITINSAPSYSATGFNSSYPCFTFTTSSLVTTSLSSAVGTGDCMLVAVMKNTGTAPQNSSLSIGQPAGTTEMAIGWNNGESLYKFYQYGNGESKNSTLGTNTNMIIIGTRLSSTMSCFLNGNSPSSTGTNAVNNANTGVYIGGGGTSFTFAGQICEIILYVGTTSTAQRQQVEGYLAWKWGLVGSLPANHPYKKWPPSP